MIREIVVWAAATRALSMKRSRRLPRRPHRLEGDRTQIDRYHPILAHIVPIRRCNPLRHCNEPTRLSRAHGDRLPLQMSAC
jgi:hypothetical protein